MRIYGVLLVGVLVASCHGGGGGDTPAPPAPANYTIGGTVSGLAGSGLELRNNVSSTLIIPANGNGRSNSPARPRAAVRTA